MDDTGRVLVTGAASGIGASTGQRLRERGWGVVLADLSPGPNVHGLDVTSEDQWSALLDEVWPLDAVVNCAGVRTRARLVDLQVDEFDRLMVVHARGSFLSVRMPSRRWLTEGAGGAVVTIASVVSTHAVPGQVHYVASKAAVAGLVRGAAAELAGHGIRVNAIAPGVIRTPMTADRLGDEAQLAWLQARVPVARVGEPDDVAAAAEWLIGPTAGYVTGVVLPVDGGWTAT